MSLIKVPARLHVLWKKSRVALLLPTARFSSGLKKQQYTFLLKQKSKILIKNINTEHLINMFSSFIQLSWVLSALELFLPIRHIMNFPSGTIIGGGTLLAFWNFS